MNEYIELGEVANVTKLAGFEFTKHFQYNTTGEIIALRAKNIRNGRLDLSDIHRINTDVSEALPRSQLNKGDIIFTYTGNGYGDCAIILESGRFHLAPNIAKISPKKIEPYFLFRYMKSNEFYQQVANFIVGSSQPTIPMATVRKLLVPNLNEPSQQAIAEILSSLDDKINLLTRQNVTLETLAQTYFRQWFVEGVEEDWKTKKLSAFFPVVTGKKDANFSTDDGLYPFFTCARDFLYAPSYSFDGSAIILAGNGDFNVKRYSGKFEAYQRTYVLMPYESKYYNWLYLLVSMNLSDITLGHRGSVINYLTKDLITEFSFQFPFRDISSQLNIIDDLFDKIDINTQQIQTLQKLRDTLLPKLISGEVKVNA